MADNNEQILQGQRKLIQSNSANLQQIQEFYKSVVQLYFKRITEGLTKGELISEVTRNRVNGTELGKLLSEIASDAFPVVDKVCKNVAKLVLAPHKISESERHLFLAEALSLNIDNLGIIHRYNYELSSSQEPLAHSYNESRNKRLKNSDGKSSRYRRNGMSGMSGGQVDADKAGEVSEGFIESKKCCIIS